MKLLKLITWDNCEYEMQDALAIWLRKSKIKFQKEVHVSDIHRRADFIAFKGGNGLINIEAKYSDFNCLIRQIKDHATYCDYSFAFIPDTVLTSKSFKKKLFSNGFGLIVYNCREKIITEVLEAHYNKPKNKELKKRISNLIRS